MTAHGGDVWQNGMPEEWLDFSANVRPGGPPDWVLEALRSGLGDVCYYPDPRMRRARDGLAEYLGLDAACVLPEPGGIAALDAAMQTGARGVLIATPCFSEYERLAAQYGLPVRRMALEALLRSPRVLPEGWMLCVGNPVNPLGRALGRDALASLLEAAELARGTLLVDEAFIAYCRERSALRWISSRERLIVAGSMTKILGIPGARLGYLCACPDTIERLARRQIPWALNCMAQAVARALPGHAGQVAEEAAVNAARRASLWASLEGLGARVYPSEASFLLARFERDVSGAAARLKAQGILVRECMDFKGVDDGRHLRLAVKDEAACARLINALGEALTCGENR